MTKRHPNHGLNTHVQSSSCPYFKQQGTFTCISKWIGWCVVVLTGRMIDSEMKDAETRGQDTPGNMEDQKDTIGRNDVQSAPMTPTGSHSKDPLKGQFEWTIEKYSELPERQTSETFEIGGYYWNLLLFPRGNQTAKGQHVSLYLAVAEPGDDDEIMQEQHASFKRSAKFDLAIVDQLNGKRDIRKSARHSFTPDQNDWGFTTFAPLKDLTEEHGLCVNDKVVIRVDVNVVPFDEYEEFDSRKETGFVGLKNQGATCYMNSLLQTLYNVNQFRKAVYKLPTSEDEKPSESMELALQSVFHMLQFTKGPVSTKDLTCSFGWDTMDAFQQHDVQELNRILCDRLEEKMKGTRVEGTINKLFEGHFTNYIECIHIDYTSVRREAFQDLQLVVKGCGNIYDSFDEYCQVEVLEGENQYEAEGHGKQDAKRGVLFESLPPVLNIQLRRFEFDFERMMMIKVNDKHEFYEEIDLDRKDEDGNPRYLSSTADKTVSNKYKLLAVLVHSGGIHGGHYYAFIRPDGQSWLKFDDETVTKATKEQALDDNWGGTPEVVQGTFGNQPRVRFSNAYMLVYVRESEWDSIMCEVTEDDISEHIRARLRAEEEAKERQWKEKAEAHLYTTVSVATDRALKRQIGSSVFFDLVDFNDVDVSLKLPKKAKFSEVQHAVEEHVGVKPDNQRYWKFVSRKNHTSRPQVHVHVGEENLISDLQDHRAIRQGETTRVNLYVECLPEDKDLHVPACSTSMSVFFKRYYPDTKKTPPRLEYLKQAVISRTVPLEDMVESIKKIAGIAPNEDILLYEEVKSEPVVMITELDDLGKSGSGLELDDGDIFIVQTVCKDDNAKFPTAIDFLQDVKNRATLLLKPLSASSDKEEKAGTFTLEMKRDSVYDDISKSVAEHLKLDHPLKVRFTGQSLYTTAPKNQPFKYDQRFTLKDMCRGVSGIAAQHVLYYEVINLPLPEFERLVTHRVAIHNAKHEDIATVTVTVPKDSTVQDLLDLVKTESKGKISSDAHLRILEIYQWKIWQVFDPKCKVEEHLDSNPWYLRAEVIPDSQVDLEQDGQLHVHCLQVEEREQPEGKANLAFPFSDPFLMNISKTETVGQLKQRVQQEMQIPDKEFATWKVVLVTSLMALEPLDDDVVIADKLNPTDMSPARLYGHFDRAAIGFCHENKNPRRTNAHNHRSTNTFAQDRALKIK